MNKIIISVVGCLILFFGLSVTADSNTGKGTNMTQQYTQVKASHILVATEDEANKILKDVRDGKISFEEAAKKFSKCPSGAEGGDLGYFGRGMMVKEFEDAAFATATGKISAPVKTQFGWHLIKVVDKK
ncbi:MAG: peptidyl-prolyl cis-trans isomerase [Alphaproteobacteria bacterium]|nr:peptidyl-prolyl cis-trans isomerase [Alphaproteobacteria bacterium]